MSPPHKSYADRVREFAEALEPGEYSTIWLWTAYNRNRAPRQRLSSVQLVYYLKLNGFKLAYHNASAQTSIYIKE